MSADPRTGRSITRRAKERKPLIVITTKVPADRRETVDRGDACVQVDALRAGRPSADAASASLPKTAPMEVAAAVPRCQRSLGRKAIMPETPVNMGGDAAAQNRPRAVRPPCAAIPRSRGPGISRDKWGVGPETRIGVADRQEDASIGSTGIMTPADGSGRPSQ